jgi:amino acid permease
MLVVITSIMELWVPDLKYGPLWIALFYTAVVIFNLFNVRRYGEIEYWLTVGKIATVVLVIILGVLLPLGLSPGARHLGTSLDYTAVPCSANALQVGQCVEAPGLSCNVLNNGKLLMLQIGLREHSGLIFMMDSGGNL